MTIDEQAQEVAKFVEQSINQNKRLENSIIAILAIVVLSGLACLIIGAIRANGLVALSGGLCQAAIIFPIKQLIRLRKENIALATLPRLVRMAGTQAGQILIEELARTLIAGFRS